MNMARTLRLHRIGMALLATMLLSGGGYVNAQLQAREDDRLTAATNEDTGWIRHDSVKWNVIPEWTAAPEIDGVLDESVWQNAAWFDGFTTAYYRIPEPSAAYMTGYDGQNLYVGGSWPVEEADKLAGLEIVLRAPGGGDAHYAAHIPIRPVPSSGWDTYWNPPRNVSGADLFTNTGRIDIGQIDFSLTETAGMTVMEAAIPLGAFAPEGITPGDEWRMNMIQVPNLYAHPLSSWLPIRNSEHWHGQDSLASVRLYASVIDQDRLGSVFFGPIPAAAGPASPTVPVPWDKWRLADTRLQYIGFTEKRLLLEQEEGEPAFSDIIAEWKAPNGGWQPVADSAIDALGNGTWEVRFSHPEPLEDGLYQLRLYAVTGSGANPRLALLTFDREDLIAGGLERIGSPADSTERLPVAWAEPSGQVNRIMELIPEQPGFRFTGLPEMPELRPDGLYQLSAGGKSLIAKQTGTVYPNEQFKEDKEWIVTNKRGETVSIPYYEDASGKRYFITAHLWYLQKQRALQETAALASTDPLGAARLLYEFSRVYEGYNPTVDYPFVNRSVDPATGPPYAYWGGVWERGWYNDLVNLRYLLDAYAGIKRTNALELLSAEVQEDVEKKFVDEVAKPSADYIFSYVHRDSNLNAQTWQGLVALGKALGEPDYIHRVVEQMNRFMARAFLGDGFWNELTLSYHAQIMNGLVAVIDQLSGWSDPEGYVSPRTGTRLDEVDGREQFPAIDKALDWLNRLVYPDGKYVPIMDTWANGRSVSPDSDAGPLLLPDARIGRLTGGAGSDQTQLYLYFQPKFGHEHLDALHLGLYANRQELLPDIGYTNSKYRTFSRSTLAHNTVVVDSESMHNGEAARRGGNIEAFIPDGGMFQAMRAEYGSAYDQVEEYSREPWFVPFADGDGEQGYVLDLFRVSGGSRHEYTLQGDANRDAFFRTDMTLDEYGPSLAPDGLYSNIRDVSQAQLSGDRYEVTLVTTAGGQEQAKLRLTGLLEAGASELYLGRAPSLRATRLQGSSADNNIEADKYTMPKLLLRRDGTNLQSAFVTMMETYGAGASPRVEAIERLEPQQAPEGAIAVQVIYGDTTDILLSNPRHEDQPLIVGDVTLRGQLGMIRLIDGEVRDMTLVGGTLLRKGQREVTGEGPAHGTITATKSRLKGDEYDALVTGAAVPEAAAGRYVVVTHPDGSANGYEIGEVRRNQGETTLLLAEHDPGFELFGDGSSAQSAFPGTRWTGEHTFSIVNLERASWTGASTAVLQNVSLQAGQRHLMQGESVQMAVYGLLTDGSVLDPASVTPQFTSSAPAVLNVDENGIVTALSEGAAVIEVRLELGETVKTAELTLSAQVPSDGLLKEPPQLQVASDPVYPGQTVSLAFTNTENWEHEIAGITVNGSSVSEQVYTVTNGKLVLSPDAFAGEGDYWVVVAAPGYRHATVEQRVTSAAALRDITVEGGGMVPEFVPGTTDYAVNVGEATDSIRVTVDTYKADAYVTVAGVVYASGTPIPIALPAEEGASLVWTGHAPDGSSKAYTLSIHRAPPAVPVGTVTGMVYGPNGGPFAGAIVSPAGYPAIRAYTDSAGNFTLTRVPSGKRWIKAVKPGYEFAVSDAVYVPAGQAATAAITLTHRSPLVMTGATRIGVRAGEAVGATSSADGTLYLVPSGTVATREAIETAGAAANGRNTPVLGGTPATLDTTGLPDGLYTLYAIDFEGVVSDGSEPLAVIDPNAPPAIIDNGSPLVRYSGSWMNYANAQNYGGSSMQARDKEAYVDIAFYGSRATVHSLVGSARGIADVYVDGQAAGELDTYYPSVRYQHPIYDTGPLPEGVHQIRFVVTGRKSQSSTNYFVNFDVLRVTEE
jgi:hypothetical protein